LQGQKNVCLEGADVCGGIAAMFGVSQFVKVVKIVIPLLAVYFPVSLLPVLIAF
jgi:phage shock protein PspC (stress-responsive transcriptional regulator)